jgi:hypothetical protein
VGIRSNLLIEDSSVANAVLGGYRLETAQEVQAKKGTGD